jgi:hypothetical protein
MFGVILLGFIIADATNITLKNDLRMRMPSFPFPNPPSRQATQASLQQVVLLLYCVVGYNQREHSKVTTNTKLRSTSNNRD